MAANREVTIIVPEAHARRIEKIERRWFQEIAQEHLLNWFEDKRRKPEENSRLGISWNKDVYAAMLKHVGSGGISRFVRDAIYEELAKSHKNLVGADYKPGIEVRSSKAKRKSPEDRIAIQAPIVVPDQWSRIIKKDHPNKTSTWVKAITQRKLEKTYNLVLPIQRGIGEFLGR